MCDERKIIDIYKCNYIKTDGEMYPLQKWYNELLDKRICDLDIFDVLRMIRQNEFTDIAISRAIDILKKNPFAGDMYDGELLEKLSTVSTEKLAAYTDEITNILANARIKNENFKWLDDEDRKNFEEVITEFQKKISNTEKQLC